MWQELVLTHDSGKRVRDAETEPSATLEKKSRLDVEASTEEVSCDISMQAEQCADARGTAADVEMCTHASSSTYSDLNTAFVKGLRMSLCEGELDQLFAACGDLKAVRMLRDKHGRFRGCAYVEFGSSAGLARALALHGTLFQSKPLFVAESVPPTQGKGKGKARLGVGPDGARGSSAMQEDELTGTVAMGTGGGREAAAGVGAGPGPCGGPRLYAPKHPKQHLQLLDSGPSPARLPADGPPRPLSNDELRSLLLFKRLDRQKSAAVQEARD